MGGVPPLALPLTTTTPSSVYPNLLFPFFSHICALFCAILHFLARIKYATLFFSSDSALFGKNTRGGVPESVWQLQVVATNCARPTTLSQYVVVATNKNRVPTQTRVPPSSTFGPSNVSTCLLSIPLLFNPLRTHPHNGGLSTSFISITSALFSSRRGVWLPSQLPGTNSPRLPRPCGALRGKGVTVSLENCRENVTAPA